MANRSKAIGKRYENEIADSFSAWWGEKFVRTPSSGALRWRNHHWIFGDLVPPESFPAVVECKYNSEIDFDEIFRKSPEDGKLTYWWYRQVLSDTARANEVLGRIMIPMLCFRVRGSKSRVAFDSMFAAALLAMESLTHMRIEIPNYPSFVVMRLDQVFEAYPREKFEKLLQG